MDLATSTTRSKRAPERGRRGQRDLESRDIRIGISGWRYEPWRGVFYPKGLPQKNELAYVSSRMRSVEINGSFYSLQRPSSYLCWHDAVPDDFVFAVKGAQFITHNKKLRDCAPPLANFFASGVLALGKKLGPILWQLPPRLRFDAERLEAFFDILPRTAGEAAELAKHHDHRVKHGAFLEPHDPDFPLRYTIEVRDETFDDPAFPRVLRKSNIALCVADTAGTWPYFEDVTADFVYVRLHGDAKIYESGYEGPALARWASRVVAWHEGDEPASPRLASPDKHAKRGPRDVFVYFDNDMKVRAPFDAIALASRVSKKLERPRARRMVETRR